MGVIRLDVLGQDVFVLNSCNAPENLSPAGWVAWEKIKHFWLLLTKIHGECRMKINISVYDLKIKGAHFFAHTLALSLLRADQ